MIFQGVLRAEDSKAPDFTMKDLEGKDFTLSSTLGKVVLLDFWATWCPPCQESIPDLTKLQKQYSEQGLQVVGISLDRRGERVVKPFAKKLKINYKILVGDSTKVIENYRGIIGIPTLFVIDRKGNVVNQFIGYVEREVLEKEIKKLL